MRLEHPWIIRNMEYIFGINMFVKKNFDNQKLIVKNWNGATYWVKPFISYQKGKIRLILTSLKRYHNFCNEKVLF